MKKELKLIAVISLMPLCIASSVGAVVREDETSPEAAPGEMQILRTTEIEDTEQAEATRQQRLDERKAKRAERLSAVQTQRIRGRCVGAQNGLKRAVERAGTVMANRTQKYTSVDEKLATILSKVDQNESIAQAMVGYQEKVVTHKEALSSYSTALADVAEMDCVADPEAFQASLEEARSLRQQIVASRADIRGYIASTLRPALQELKQKLNAT